MRVFAAGVIALGVAWALLVAPPASAASADAPSGKIAVLDLQKIIALSKRGQQAREAFKAKVLSRQKDIDHYRAELEQLEKDYQTKAASLSGADRDAYEGRFRARVTDLKRKGEDVREELEREQKKLTDAIVEDAQRLTRVYAARQGYVLVIEAQSAVGGYASPSADITEAILEIYDAETIREEKK